MARLLPQRDGQPQLQRKKKTPSRKPQKDNARENRRGPRLPSTLRRELHLENLRVVREDREGEEEEEEQDEEEGEAQLPISALPSDIYEYEEDQAPEESRKNRRFDDVERFEYELPSDFEDEEIDEDAADGEDLGRVQKGSKVRNSSASGKQRRSRVLQSDDEKDNGDEDISSESEDLDTFEQEEDIRREVDDSDAFEQRLQEEPNRYEDEEDAHDGEPEQLQDEDAVNAEDDSDAEADDGDDDEERHKRMLDAVRTPKKKERKEMRGKRVELLSEAYPESEFNINPSADANSLQQITVEDLMAPLQNTTGFGSLRKRMQQLERKGVVMDAPLPKALQDRLSRKAGYERASEEISKWQDIVKKNREAASLVFTQRPDLTAASTAELVSKFEPTTDLEKEVASLLQVNGLAEDTSEATDGLGFNKLTMDEVKERQERLAKMRNMLSYHEAKAKRVKKIKSKTYHRLLQKDRKGKGGTEDDLDPESIKEAAIRAEFKRAQERMTLKHKNTSKWAKRIIKRGLKAKEDGSREALAEQLRTHSALTRKIQSLDNASSSDDSSDEMDTDSGSGDDKGGPSLPAKAKVKLLAKAKVETLKVLEGDAEAEIPTSGLFSLPFMARAIEKKRKQAQSEAMAVLEQLEQIENNDNSVEDFDFESERGAATKAPAGRLAFGDMARPVSNSKEREPDMLVEDGSSSDEGGYEEDRVIPAAKRKTPVISKKRKAESSGNIDISAHVESQGHKLQVTEEAWIDGGVNRATAFSVSVNGGYDLNEDADVPFEVPEARGTNVGVAGNPWLYGVASEKGSITTEGTGVAKTGKKEVNPGPLVTSASVEAVTIAGAKKKANMVQNSVPSDTVIEEDAGPARPLSSSDSEDDDDGVKGSGFCLSAENASQADLIQRAFAGDDVEADFKQMKAEALNEEVPLGEAALSLRGWGQWTDVQKKRGPPSWMVRQQEERERSRDQALNKRKDSKLKYVIISERMDKKAEKFLAPKLPFPFTSRDVFEKSIRMPIGREFNTDQAFRDMIRPAVVKDAGVIIDPIKYKMSEAKMGDSAGSFEDKRDSEKKMTNGSSVEVKRKNKKRSNVFTPGDKRKSEKRLNGVISGDKNKGEKRANGVISGDKNKGEKRADGFKVRRKN